MVKIKILIKDSKISNEYGFIVPNNLDDGEVSLKIHSYPGKKYIGTNNIFEFNSGVYMFDMDFDITNDDYVGYMGKPNLIESKLIKTGETQLSALVFELEMIYPGEKLEISIMCDLYCLREVTPCKYIKDIFGIQKPSFDFDEPKETKNGKELLINKIFKGFDRSAIPFNWYNGVFWGSNGFIEIKRSNLDFSSIKKRLESELGKMDKGNGENIPVLVFNMNDGGKLLKIPNNRDIRKIGGIDFGEYERVYRVSDITLDEVESVRFYGVRNGMLIDVLAATGKKLDPIVDQDIYDKCLEGKCASEEELEVINDQIWSNCSYDVLVIPYKLVCHLFDERYEDKDIVEDYFKKGNTKNILFE